MENEGRVIATNVLKLRVLKNGIGIDVNGRDGGFLNGYEDLPLFICDSFSISTVPMLSGEKKDEVGVAILEILKKVRIRNYKEV